MASNKFAWLATEKGQRFVFTGIACIGGGLLCLHIVPKTILLNKYKDFLQQYKMGVEVPVPPNVYTMVDEVMDDMDIPPVRRNIIKPFVVFGFDILHVGTTTSKYGAILGIPSAFACVSADNEDFKHLLVKNQPVHQESKYVRDLKEALVMSPEAKKFAIAREIAASQTVQPYLNGFYPVTVILGVYSFTHSLNRRMNLYARPLSLRCVLYSIMGLFGFGVWAFLNDFSTVYFDTQADKEICKLGKDYVKGGVEFYTKTLERNVALRHLLGKEGEKLYSVLGNDVFFLRQKRLPLVHRKSFMEIKLNDIMVSSDESNPL